MEDSLNKNKKLENYSIIPILAFKDNYIWAFINWEKKVVLLVDPGEPEAVIDFLEKNQLNLEIILITHHHNDHVGGVSKLIERFNPSIYGPLHEKVKSTHVVEDKQLLKLNNFCTFQVLAVPGHTLDHVAYFSEELKILLCGDTLFSAGCGRVFEGTYEQMYKSLNKLVSLPDETQVYCAHEYTLQNLNFSQFVEPDNIDTKLAIQNILENKIQNHITLPSTLAFEKKVNPFLRCKKLIYKMKNVNQINIDTEEKMFQYLRELKNNFSL